MTVPPVCCIIKIMKKFIVFCLICALCLSMCGCASNSYSAESGKLQIAATLFPAYDFARQIAGGRAEVTLLVPPGSEAHSYEPTPQDIILLNRCSLLIANGGENETWLDAVMDSLDTAPRTIYMLNCVNALEEETVDGMQSGGILSRGHSHEHGHEAHEHDHSDAEDIEYDEHVWTSPVNAIAICNAICAQLCALDPEYSAYYTENCRIYTEKLAALDAQFRAVVSGARYHTVIFADRFPVRYFVEEYGLDYYAAFPGCADDAEPSARTVAFLIDKVRNENVPAVFYIEFSNQKMADIIAEDTGCKTLLFHSCHNVTAEQLETGVEYLTLMQQNVANLKEALG